MLPQIKI